MLFSVVHLRNKSTIFRNILKVLNDLIQPQIVEDKKKHDNDFFDESMELSFMAWEMKVVRTSMVSGKQCGYRIKSYRYPLRLNKMHISYQFTNL